MGEVFFVVGVITGLWRGGYYLGYFPTAGAAHAGYAEAARSGSIHLIWLHARLDRSWRRPGAGVLKIFNSLV